MQKCSLIWLFIVGLITTSVLSMSAAVELPGPINLDFSAVRLPNAWRLTPTGQHLQVQDTPLGLACDRDGAFLAAVTCGHGSHMLYLIDAHTWQFRDRIDLGRSFLGVTFSEDGKIYASGGERNVVYIVNYDDGKLTKEGEIFIRPEAEPGYIGAVHCVGKLLYVLELDGERLSVVDLPSREVTARIPVEGNPYDVALSPDRKRAYVSLWGQDKVAVVDLAAQKVIADIPTGLHPNDLEISADGRWLYVACAESNAVDVIDTVNLNVTVRVSCSLLSGRGVGSTTNALALDSQRNWLYAANADNNCVAVIDVTEPQQARTIGFIPVGWYPTACLVQPEGQSLYVANAKGLSSHPNKVPWQGAQYILAILRGAISRIDVPSLKQLAVLTRRAYHNRPDSPRRAEERVRPSDTIIPALMADAEKFPIKYVIYIVKENQTYDAYFGDIPEGNGDPELCLWPEEVSPNHHALAWEFVLLDNFYNDAEVSKDGHPWCYYAYCTDAVEKALPSSYGGKGSLICANPWLNGPLGWPSSGSLWRLCAQYGVPYRCYGEGGGITPDDTDPQFISWQIETPGIELDKAKEFLRDLNEHIQDNQVPRFMSMCLPKDHTTGGGVQTRRAQVAEHDLALGMIVEGVSHSSIWQETAIFVVEDDTQNSYDHVDSHRGPCLVISPWVKRHHRESTMYNGCSVIRTIELILGLPPMTQHDAVALPMWNCFTNQPDFTPYTTEKPRINLELNKATARGAGLSLALDFSSYTALRRSKEVLGPDHNRLLREIIWRAVKGADSPYPPLVHAPFVWPQSEDKEPAE